MNMKFLNAFLLLKGQQQDMAMYLSGFSKTALLDWRLFVTRLYNLILTTSKPPSNWLKALVTPIPKKLINLVL
jgi:hypothetical protein